jgi:hypothetical protein
VPAIVPVHRRRARQPTHKQSNVESTHD